MPARDKLHGVEHKYLDAANKPIEQVAGSIVGLVATADDADTTTFPLNENTLVTGEADIAKAGTSGTLRQALLDIFDQQPALVVVTRVNESADVAMQTSSLIGTINNERNSFIGMQCMLSAESDTGFKPRLIIAPEFSQIEAVGVALEALAKKLHAIAIIDGKADGLSAAVQDKSRYDEVIFVDPGIRATGEDGNETTRAASAAVAGHIVRNDVERGYHTSPSNQRMQNILGPSKNIDYISGSKTCMANVLSANDICAVVRKAGGVYFWGNRLANGTLIPHQRIRYIVGDSILAAHEEYVDRNLTSDYVSFIRGRVNALIRRLTLQGIISGGECWIDPALNKASFVDNTAYWDYKLGFYNVAETIVFRQAVTDEYNNTIVDRIAA
ncbi:Putative prophage major tail sheath protein [BD1-7 clade bacterium]|uniref:Prophage major tail sheath protein n=1 Tax=BD1-7 clade bacterium TaxID=2029982 RepID=A0A5S9P2P4_9GAMM|nr:Putative prophage major tail sheath protein [BD1-7 clade bacterium]CAA0122826.1 Putative prophage major tail sheath protein [BD1-7 clade bacterium]